jgi:hypothetical protein
MPRSVNAVASEPEEKKVMKPKGTGGRRKKMFGQLQKMQLKSNVT